MNGELVRICAVAILCTVVGMILKQVKGEFLGPVRIAGGVLIFGALIAGLGDTVVQAAALFADSGVNEYVEVMLRALGIALLTRICTDLCRDCGEGTVATGVEMAGKLAILILCLPMIGEIIGYASELLQWDE